MERTNATENWKMDNLYLNDSVNDKNFLSIFALDLLKSAWKISTKIMLKVEMHVA